MGGGIPLLRDGVLCDIVDVLRFFKPWRGCVRIKLGEVLDKKGMSTAQFARDLKVAPKQLSRLFKDGANPRIKELMLWAEHLGVKVKDLIEEDGKNTVTITRPTTAIESIKQTKIGIRKKEKIKKNITKNK